MEGEKWRREREDVRHVCVYIISLQHFIILWMEIFSFWFYEVLHSQLVCTREGFKVERSVSYRS